MAETTKRHIDATDIANLPPLIDVATAAAIRGNSEKFIRDMLRKGKLKGCKLGQSWRVNTAAFLTQCGLA